MIYDIILLLGWWVGGKMRDNELLSSVRGVLGFSVSHRRWSYKPILFLLLATCKQVSPFRIPERVDSSVEFWLFRRGTPRFRVSSESKHGGRGVGGCVAATSISFRQMPPPRWQRSSGRKLRGKKRRGSGKGLQSATSLSPTVTRRSRLRRSVADPPLHHVVVNWHHERRSFEFL